MNTIPFFYFDILARMIPGGLLLGLLRGANLQAPCPWPTLLAGQESWKAVIVPLIFAASAYLLGALLDGVFRWTTLAEKFGRQQYEKVLVENKGLRPIPATATAQKFQHDAWQWLALVVGQKNAAAFSLAHRFQADSRLFVLSSVPASGLVGLSIAQRLTVPFAGWIAAAGAIGVLVVFIVSAFNAENNRWIWTMAVIAQTKEADWPDRWKPSATNRKG
jgi:hypothetical protein